MADTEEEAAWRVEFEQFGEEQTRFLLHWGLSPEEKRQFAYRWLAEQARDRKVREVRTYQYAKYTFFAAVAAVIVGIIGIITTLVH